MKCWCIFVYSSFKRFRALQFEPRTGMIWQTVGALSEGLGAVGLVSGQESGCKPDDFLKHPPDFCSLNLVPWGSCSCWCWAFGVCSLHCPDALAPPAPIQLAGWMWAMPGNLNVWHTWDCKVSLKYYRNVFSWARLIGMLFSFPSVPGRLKEQTVNLAFMVIHIGPQRDEKIKVNEKNEGKTSSKLFLNQIQTIFFYFVQKQALADLFLPISKYIKDVFTCVSAFTRSCLAGCQCTAVQMAWKA